MHLVELVSYVESQVSSVEVNKFRRVKVFQVELNVSKVVLKAS